MKLFAKSTRLGSGRAGSSASRRPRGLTNHSSRRLRRGLTQALGTVRYAPLIAAWLLGLVAVFVEGREPNPYLIYVRHLQPPFPYPLEGVLIVGAFVTAQVVLLLAVLRPATYRRSWGRSALAVLVCIAFACYTALGLMHAPPYIAAYFLWLLGMLGAVVCVFFWSALSALRAALAVRRATVPN